MANIMHISKKSIAANATHYGISDIIGLCDKVLGIMSYDVTDAEYDFLVNTSFIAVPFLELPNAYLPKAAKIIKDTRSAEDTILARAKLYFNMASMSFKNEDLDTYSKYHNMLIDMVRDKAISPEFLRDLYGSISAN